VKRTYKDNSFVFIIQYKSITKKRKKWKEVIYPFDSIEAANREIDAQIRIDNPKKVIKEEII
jgi:hypothetical protein